MRGLKGAGGQEDAEEEEADAGDNEEAKLEDLVPRNDIG